MNPLAGPNTVDSAPTTGGTPAQEPIAIVGMGCLFPGAQGHRQFQGLLRRGDDAVREVPPGYWDADALIDRREGAGTKDELGLDRTYCGRGGFLDPVDFDPTEFGIPPTILEATDTAQLLGLLTARMALEDAGYHGEAAREFDRSRTSVILGVTGALELVVPLGARLGHPAWRKALSESGVDPDVADDVMARIAESYVGWQENSFPGLLGNVVAGRIANRLNLRGTNCVVDAACASSLSAIHLAMLELRAGQADMVLSGGVDAFNDIFMFMCFTKTQALSRQGDARPFSAEADGTVLGEGVGMVVLKRLSDARRDGDRVYAVIRGMGTSSDGRSQSIYAPRSEGQAEALRNAYRLAGVSPATVGFVEAHGTGTKVGDVVEFEALKTVFEESRPDGLTGPWCNVGSVKSQIGHTKSAAGAASLVKAALALHHKTLPATVKVGAVNPKLGAEASPFHVGRGMRPWLRAVETDAVGSNGPVATGDDGAAAPRRAGVSSFGFGGSNFHLVVEEAGPDKTEPAWDGSTQIFALCGETADVLAAGLATLAADAAAGLKGDALAARAEDSRRAFRADAPWRMAMVVERGTTLAKLADDAGKALAAAGSSAGVAKPGGGKGDDVFVGGPGAPGGLAALFPGQGSHYVGMGRDLALIFPEAFDAWRASDSEGALAADLPAMGAMVFPRTWDESDDAGRAAMDARLTRTDAAQPALGAAAAAAWGVARRFGVKPDALAGHSYGELVALHAAGRLDGGALRRLSRLRGALMAGDGAGADRGTMMAVQAPLAELEALVAERGGFDGTVVLANRNAPQQGVLSGSRAGIETARAACAEKGWAAKPLAVGGAFHSGLMAEAGREFARAMKSAGMSDADPAAPQVMANVTGGAYPDGAAEAAELLGRQLVSPVRFVDEIEALYESGVRTFLEVGPKAALTGLVGRILGERPHSAVAMDASSGRKSGLGDLARAIARLAALGHAVDLAAWEAPVTGSARRKPGMVVPLTGINYRSPKTGPARPPRAPKVVAVAVAAPVPAAPAAVSLLAAGAPPRPATFFSSNGGSSMTTPAIPAPASAVQSVAIFPTAAPTVGSAALSDVLATVQEGLRAMQAIQQQTAAAHQRFLEGQEAAHRTFQAVMEGQRRLMEGTGSAAPTAVSTPAVTTPAVSTPHPAVAAPVAAPSVAAPVPVAAPAMAPVAAGPVPVAVAPSAPAAGEGVSEALLATVCELTGYPREMLDLDMDLEADLGIDSIKRVEILAAVQRAVPGLPPVDSSYLGSLRTLRQIVEQFGVMAPASAVIAAVGVGVAAPMTTVIASDAVSEALFETVCELTGYPREMLAADMDLEADLGIDSIKRVEILAGVQRRMPGLPAIDSSYLGSLRTLGQIVEQFAAQAAVGAGAAAVTPGAAVTVPVQVAGGSADEVRRALLEVVGELTGYPAEMLDPTMDLEADLGIDSIKRVEILAAVQKRMPELPPVDSSLLGSLRTLESIVEQMTAGATAPAGAVACGTPCGGVATGSPASAVAGGIGRQVLESRMLPAPAGVGALNLAAGHAIVVTDDGGGFADALASELRRAGHRAEVVDGSGAGLEKFDKVAGLVMVAPASPEGDDAAEARAKSAFRTARAVSARLRSAAAAGGAFVVTVSRMDGAFGLSGGSAAGDAVAGSLAGLAKTLSHEWPAVLCRALDVDPTMDAAIAANAVAREILSAGEPLETGLRADGRRMTLRMVPTTDAASGALPLTAGDVVLVTGGARGVTAEAAVALAAAVPGLTLALIGRSAAPTAEPAWLAGAVDPASMKKALLANGFSPGAMPKPAELESAYRAAAANREIAATLVRVEAAGGKAVYRAADIRDGAAAAALLDGLRRELGPIRGLVHGAGVLEDRRIEDKTDVQFDRVWDTKVGGLRSLLAATAGNDLRVLALFSSVSGRFGRLGQIDYAMANEALNKMARREAARRPGCRVTALNWGPWQGGMVTPELKREFERLGIGLIPLVAGARALVDELRRPAGDGAAIEVVLGDGFPEGPSGQSPAAQTAEAPAFRAAVPAVPRMAQVFERAVSLDTHPILRDHTIGGQAVLPAALMMEWLGHAALHANPGLTLRALEGFRVTKGVALPEDGAPVLRAMAGKAARGDGGVFEVDVELRGAGGSGGNGAGGDTLHAKARAILANGLPAAPRHAYDAALSATNYPGGAEAAYRDVLFHGSGFQAIAAIEGHSPRGMVAMVKAGPAPSGWMDAPVRGRWLADPMAIDAALQAGIVYSAAHLGAPCLPSFVGAWRLFAPAVPAGGLRMFLDAKEAAGSRLTADATFVDLDGGAVVMRLEGVEWTVDPSLAATFRRRADAPGAVAPR